MNTIRVSLGKRFRLGTRGAPAGVLGSGVDGPLRNQLLIAQMIKILGDTQTQEQTHVRLHHMIFRKHNPKTHDAILLPYTIIYGTRPILKSLFLFVKNSL